MTMKRLLFFITILSVVAAAGNADTQKARVRTARLPGKEYELVPDVEISIKGVDSNFKSDKNGLVKFELRPLKLKTGDEFIIDSIYKRNFLPLNQQSHNYSPNTTTDIVLVDLKKQADEKQKATAKMLDNAQKNYDREISRLKHELDNKTISLENYREIVRDLQNNFEKYIEFIPEYANRLTLIDYETIDKDSEIINLALLNGDFTTADSILKKLNVVAMADSLIRNHEAIAKHQKRLKTFDANNKKDAERIAEMLYSKHLIAASKYQNDSAVYYLQKRIELMPDNPIFLLETGAFVSSFLEEHTVGLEYFNKALNAAVDNYGEDHEIVALSCNYIGEVYHHQSNYSEALKYLEKALTIRQNLFGENHQYVAQSYNNIGITYTNQGLLFEALKCFEKALNARLEIFGETHPDVADSYLNIGSLFFARDHFSEAINYFEKALTIKIEFLGENNPEIAQIYDKIGVAYRDQGISYWALKNHGNALKIRQKIFGDNHPDVANSYNFIGMAYLKQDNINETKNNIEKALGIRLLILGEAHPDVAKSYHKMGGILLYQGKTEEALEYSQKALKTQLEIFGEINNDVADTYNTIGGIYLYQNNPTEALKYLEKSLKIQLELKGDSHPDVADSYYNIAGANFAQNRFTDALNYYEKALKIKLEFVSEDDTDVVNIKNSIKAVKAEIDKQQRN